MTYLFYVLILLISSVSTVLLYVKSITFAAEKLTLENAERISFIVPVLVCIPMFLLVYKYTGSNNDLLFDVSNLSLAAVLSAALLIGLCALSEKTENFSPLVLAVSCLSMPYILPIEIDLFGDGINPYIQKLLVSATWFAFACVNLLFREDDGLFGTHTLMLSVFCFILYLLSGISSTVFLFSATIAGIAIGYALLNFPPAQLIINKAAMLSFGFLIGFILIGCCADGMTMPTLIIFAYAIVAVLAFAVETLLLKKHKDELLPQTQYLVCTRVMFLLIFLAIIQIHVANTFSMLFFALLFSAWATGKAGIERTNQSFMEINREVFANIRKGLQDIR